MKITPECVSCLIKRAAYEANLVDENLAGPVVKEAALILGNGYGPDVASYQIATKMHRKVYAMLGTDDPYREMKELSNKAAEDVYDTAAEYVEQAEDRLSAAALVSVIGNIMDFGIRGAGRAPSDLREYFYRESEVGLFVNDIHEAEKYFGRGILFFTDNCGEVVLDRILLKELKKLTPFLGVVVKGKPILTDATLEDAERYGIYEIADAVYSTENDFVGFNYDDLSDELKKKMDECLIIAKGMANFEVFSEFEFLPILYMMRTKCSPVAKAVGTEKDKNIVKLFE